MNILLIEDDEVLCNEITIHFNHKGAQITAVNDGDTAVDLIQADISYYDLVLLDIMLPNINGAKLYGFTLCRKIRERSDIPIIFITACGLEEDVLYGYDRGCDDYIIKPFRLGDLHAKCDALIRRANGTIRNHTLECGHLRLNTHRQQCFVDDNEIKLTPKEYAVLKYLMENKNCTLTRRQFLERIWRNNLNVNCEVVNTNISRLKKVLGETAAKQIKTCNGSGEDGGYKLTEE